MLEEAKQTARDQYMTKTNAATQAGLFVAPHLKVSKQLSALETKEITRVNSSSHLLKVTNGANEIGTLRGKSLSGVSFAPQVSRNFKPTPASFTSQSQMVLEMRLLPSASKGTG